MWQLTLLRIGATALPEKYSSLYQYAATKMLSMNEAAMGGKQNTVYDTYALAFGMDVEIALILLEDNPVLQYHYIKNFENKFYKYVKYHRNAFFNIGHLAFMTLIKNPSKFEDPNYNNEMIRWDILDQLWRFNTSGWGNGIRNYNLTVRPNSTRMTSLNPEIAKGEIETNKEKWRNFFDNNVYGSLFSWLEDTLDFEDDLHILPLTVAEMGIHSFLWEKSKFYHIGGNPTGNGLSQAVPTSYLVVYWMGKAFNIF